MAAAYRGHVERVDEHHVRGWAASSSDPGTIFDVRLHVNGRLCGTARNDQPREDLYGLGLSAGLGGFYFVFPPELARGGEGLEVRAELPDGSTCAVGADAVIGGPGATAASAAGSVSGTASKRASDLFRVEIEHCDQRCLRGWAASLPEPGAIFEVQIHVNDLHYGSLRNDRSRWDLHEQGLTEGRGGFHVEFPPELVRAEERLRVRVELPDGSSSPVTSVPVASRGVIETRGWATVPVTAERPEVAIVVPVHDAFEDVRTCIERLERHTSMPATLIMIDDASPDPRIGPLLARAAERPGVRVLTNASNLGFARTVNRGIEAAGRADVVLLNSDARVTPGWLEGLVETALSRPRVATVTPLSDNSGAFSAPDAGRFNALPPATTEADFARLVRRNADRLRPSLPTGNGFCMYVRRAAIDAVGALDGEAFPQGYGEENDFCMRALRAGWSHLLDDATYVFHERSASFGEAKQELMAAGRAIVDERYPEYRPLLAAFDSSDMMLARYRVRQAALQAASGEPVLPRVLFVYSTQSGGTPQTNRDLMASLAGVVDAWTLRCDAESLFLGRVDGGEVRPVRSHALGTAIEPLTHVSAEYDATVGAWLREFDFSLLHVRHLAWHSLNLPALGRAAGVPVVLSFHDFYTLCPTVKLMDERSTYCGGTCTAGEGRCRTDLWPTRTFPVLKHGWVGRWREMFARVMPHCDAFVTTSASARATVLGVFPEIADRFEIIPHGRDFTPVSTAFTLPRPASPIRILVPGNISEAKGSAVIEALLEHDTAGQLEFHVLGATDGLAPRRGLVLHGTYRREEFAERVGAIAPTVGAVFSIWDETWCHTLTELWSVGLPAVVFDYGTVATRVRRSGGGWVFDHDDVPALHRRLTTEVRDLGDYLRKRAAVSAWQVGEGEASGTALMGLRYLSVYRRAMRKADRGRHPFAPRDASTDVPRSAASPAAGPAAGPVAGPVANPVASPVTSLAANPIAVLRDRSGAHASLSGVDMLRLRTRNSLLRELRYLDCSPSALLAALASGTLTRAIVQPDALPEHLLPAVLHAVEERRLSLVLDLPRDPDDGPPDAVPSRLVEAACGTISPGRIVSGSPRLDGAEPLPPVLDPALLAGVEPERGAVAADRTTVVWMLPTDLPSSEHGRLAIERVVEVFERARRHRPELHLKLLGESLPEGTTLAHRAEFAPVPASAVTDAPRVRWLVAQTREASFALAPTLSAPSARSGAEIACLELAALGLSGVFTDLPGTRHVVERSGSGLLVAGGVEASAEMWYEAIVRCARDVELVRESGRAARRWVESHGLGAETHERFDATVLALFDAEPTMRA